MKVIGIASTALALLFAMSAPAWTQERHEQEKKEEPAKHEQKKVKHEKPSAREEKPTTRQEEKSARPEERSAQQHEGHAQPEMQPHQYRGRIPEEHFRSHFGQQHSFRVREDDYRNGRQFQYGGYSFGFVSEWPRNWQYSQDVYVIEIDGVYYLCNAEYPGVNLELSIAL